LPPSAAGCLWGRWSRRWSTPRCGAAAQRSPAGGGRQPAAGRQLEPQRVPLGGLAALPLSCLPTPEALSPPGPSDKYRVAACRPPPPRGSRPGPRHLPPATSAPPPLPPSPPPTRRRRRRRRCRGRWPAGWTASARTGTSGASSPATLPRPSRPGRPSSGAPSPSPTTCWVGGAAPSRAAPRAEAGRGGAACLPAHLPPCTPSTLHMPAPSSRLHCRRRGGRVSPGAGGAARLLRRAAWRPGRRQGAGAQEAGPAGGVPPGGHQGAGVAEQRAAQDRGRQGQRGLGVSGGGGEGGVCGACRAPAGLLCCCGAVSSAAAGAAGRPTAGAVLGDERGQASVQYCESMQQGGHDGGMGGMYARCEHVSTWCPASYVALQVSERRRSAVAADRIGVAAMYPDTHHGPWCTSWCSMVGVVLQESGCGCKHNSELNRPPSA
jgi:hypothetical protein